ncbi:hypothetical protein CapIbe_000637 [Capra ibex]
MFGSVKCCRGFAAHGKEPELQGDEVFIIQDMTFDMQLPLNGDMLISYQRFPPGRKHWGWEQALCQNWGGCKVLDKTSTGNWKHSVPRWWGSSVAIYFPVCPIEYGCKGNKTPCNLQQ